MAITNMPTIIMDMLKLAGVERARQYIRRLRYEHDEELLGGYRPEMDSHPGEAPERPTTSPLLRALYWHYRTVKFRRACRRLPPALSSLRGFQSPLSTSIIITQTRR